jgi:hypothetical protein
MRADIHGGPEHDTLQYEAGYIDARPTSDRSTKTSCDARPDHTSGPKPDIAPLLRLPSGTRLKLLRAGASGLKPMNNGSSSVDYPCPPAHIRTEELGYREF